MEYEKDTFLRKFGFSWLWYQFEVVTNHRKCLGSWRTLPKVRKITIQLLVRKISENQIIVLSKENTNTPRNSKVLIYLVWSKWFWAERKFNTECYFFDPGPKSFDPTRNILDPAKTVLNYWTYYLGISIFFSGVMPSFRCPKCSSSFHSTSELIVHHKSKHSKKMWQIPVIFFKCHQLPMLSMF